MRHFGLAEWAWIAALAACFAFLVFVGVHSCRQRGDCERSGGTAVDYNCRYQLIGKQMHRVCDWRCVVLDSDGREVSR